MIACDLQSLENTEIVPELKIKTGYQFPLNMKPHNSMDYKDETSTGANSLCFVSCYITALKQIKVILLIKSFHQL